MGQCTSSFRKTDGNLLDRLPKVTVITEKIPGKQASKGINCGPFRIDLNPLPNPTVLLLDKITFLTQDSDRPLCSPHLPRPLVKRHAGIKPFTCKPGAWLL